MNELTRNQRRRVRIKIIAAIVITAFIGLLAAAYAARVSERITLNRIAGSCTEPKISGFMVAGQQFYCEPFYPEYTNIVRNRHGR